MSLTILTVLLALAACMMSTTEAVKSISTNPTPVDACLFYCSECYNNDEPKMMICANDVCPGAATSGHDFVALANANDCTVDVVPESLYRKNFSV